MKIKQYIRSYVRLLAKYINRLSNGKITPNQITYIGLIAHIPIGFLIANKDNLLAAILLVIFGLFDTLDGELARLQKKDSPQGMVLDASTDRFKEVIIYAGITYQLLKVYPNQPAVVYAIIALGASMSVSYIKAKGEAVFSISNKSIRHQDLNRLFSSGLLSFEVRISIIILALITNQLYLAVAIIAILASYTAVDRLIKITKKLK